VRPAPSRTDGGRGGGKDGKRLGCAGRSGGGRWANLLDRGFRTAQNRQLENHSSGRHRLSLLGCRGTGPPGLCLAAERVVAVDQPRAWFAGGSSAASAAGS
jgi:hypothetical protein